MANTPGIDVFRQGGQWKVKQQGNQRATSTHTTKAVAVSTGRNIARARGAELTIKNMDGRIGSKDSYGPDPHPPRG